MSTKVEKATSSRNDGNTLVSGNLTDFEKQLIVLSKNAIWIEHQDGHRWIEHRPLDNWDYNAELQKHGLSVNNKIYGGVKEAVAVVNETWIAMYGYTLVDEFNQEFDVKNDVLNVNLNHDRIDKVDNGRGGLY